MQLLMLPLSDTAVEISNTDSVDPRQACRHVGLYVDFRQQLRYVSSCQRVVDCYSESASTEVCGGL